MNCVIGQGPSKILKKEKHAKNFPTDFAFPDLLLFIL
jgi:hypothetical protein